MSKSKKLKKPREASWRSSLLYRVHLFDSRWPVCGFRLVWAVVGYKWVRICTPITNIKFKMRRTDWDQLGLREQVT